MPTTSSGVYVGGQPPTASCVVEGCDRKVAARGMCSAHYTRWYRHGDPLGGGLAWGAAQQWLQLAANSDTDECLPYPFAVNKGYGAVRFRGRAIAASRAVMILAFEDHPKLEVAHKCGNPICCNPKHLRWDTHAGNMSDTVAHGTSTKGERNPQAKLTPELVREIRRRKGLTTQRALAVEYGVSEMTVSAIMTGSRWGWVK